MPPEQELLFGNTHFANIESLIPVINERPGAAASDLIELAERELRKVGLTEEEEKWVQLRRR